MREMVQKQNLGTVHIGTVDSYQGQEFDVVIFSMVRSNPARKLNGFCSNVSILLFSETRLCGGSSPTQRGCDQSSQSLLFHRKRLLADAKGNTREIPRAGDKETVGVRYH